MAMNHRLLRPRASGAAFDPRSIAGLGLWLDATVNSSLTFNGNTVSEWRDLSGNARHFSQGTAASQPDGVARTQNGRRVIDFSEGDQLNGNSASLELVRNLGGATLACVAALDSTGGGVVSPFRASSGSSAASGRFGLDSFAVGTLRSGGRRLDADVFQSFEYAYTDETPFVHVSLFDWENSDLFAYQNGVIANSTTNFQTAGNTSDTSSLGVIVGYGFGKFFDGFVAEVLVWQRVLSQAERQSVERYLGAKWGITVA